MKSSDRVILHCDLNNFFASVEMILNPALIGNPVAVCGDPEARTGIVLAKCEIAKKHGVKTGDTVWQAKQKCPGIITVIPRHSEYGRYSRLVRNIYYRYTDLVESFGIDECWLDVTGSTKLFGDGLTIANKIRADLKRELGLTISVGVSWNKTFAKIGSDIKKPDAVTVITRENYKDIIWNLPASDMLFVGRKSKLLFAKLNIKTIGDLANFDAKLLAPMFGITAQRLVACARGEDDDKVADYHYNREVKSVGNGTTTKRDMVNITEVEKVVYVLCEEVAYRMRRKGVKGRTISLSVRDQNLKWKGAQTSVINLTSSASTIFENAMKVFYQLYVDKKDENKPEATTNDGFAKTPDSVTFPPVHSIRVAVSNLVFNKENVAQQLSLFNTEEQEVEERNDEISKLFDKIRKKHGTSKVSFGTALDSLMELDFETYDE